MNKTKNLYPTEDEEQMVLAKYLDARFGYYGWIHVPNQRWAKPQYLRKLAKMGVKKGFPDILIFEPGTVSYPAPANRGRCLVYGMAIELKRKVGGKTSPEQLYWNEELDERGWHSVIAGGAAEAIEEIEKVYGKWDGK